MEQACANWAMHNTSALDFSEQINQAGSHLVELIQSHKLSYAEVNFIIVSTRQSGCKCQLRDEQGAPGKESYCAERIVISAQLAALPTSCCRQEFLLPL